MRPSMRSSRVAMLRQTAIPVPSDGNDRLEVGLPRPPYSTEGNTRGLPAAKEEDDDGS